MLLTYHSENGRSVTLGRPPYLLVAVTGIHGPSVQVYDYKKYQQDGATFVADSLEPRDITVSVKIVRDVIVNRMALLDTIAPKQKGALVLQRDGFVRRIGCVVTQAPDGSSADGSRLTFTLRAHNPYWRAESEVRTDIAVWEAVFEWPLVIPHESGIDFGQRTQSRVVSVFNGGAADIGMRVQFYANGSLSKPALIQAETFEQIKLHLDMNAGDIVEVQTTEDSQYVRITRAGGNPENAFWAWDVDNTFLQLKQGDNLFRYDAESGASMLDVSLHYDIAYLGV